MLSLLTGMLFAEADESGENDGNLNSEISQGSLRGSNHIALLLSTACKGRDHSVHADRRIICSKL